MKKILFFMHRFSSGGAEKMTILLANELSRHGYDVTFIMREDEGETKYLLDSAINIINMNLKMKSKIIKNFKNIYLLRKEFKKGYDVCFGVTTSMSLIAAISKAYSNSSVRVIPVIHNTISIENRSFSLLRNKLIKFFDQFTAKTVVVSKEAAEDYIKTCKIDNQKVLTIYNPVISPKIYELADEKVEHKWLQNNRSHKVIINAGRLSYQKNHELMIRTLKDLRKHIDVRLIILGIGELEASLRDLCKELDVTEYVDFLGYSNNPYAYFSKVDAFVLSSRYEGLPTVLIEALACGCKVVSTDCPSGPREILDNGKFGVLADQNQQSLMNAINHAMQLDAINHDEIKEYCNIFTVDNVVKNYIELIENI